MPHDQEIPDADIEAFIQKDMAMLPTMMVFLDALIEEELLNMIGRRGESLLVPEAIDQMSARLRGSIELSSRSLTEEEIRSLQSDPVYLIEKLPNMTTNLQKLHRLGATIGIGTDIGGAYA
jgi:hypothetical protein